MLVRVVSRVSWWPAGRPTDDGDRELEVGQTSLLTRGIKPTRWKAAHTEPGRWSVTLLVPDMNIVDHSSILLPFTRQAYRRQSAYHTFTYVSRFSPGSFCWTNTAIKLSDGFRWLSLAFAGFRSTNLLVVCQAQQVIACRLHDNRQSKSDSANNGREQHMHVECHAVQTQGMKYSKYIRLRR